jgi:uncharacterized protein involved in exopolysaccharide biosynthesis/Mrp family chromosome partitioning ATPase
MSQQKPTVPPPSLNAQDFLYVLFKHKWKILMSAALGISAAVAVYFLRTPVYESQAKLLVRYVVDTSAIDQVESRATVGPSGDNMINSEVEILTSWDLAIQVAKVVGVERLMELSNGAADVAKAARNVRLGLSVSALKGTNIITVSYKNKNPELATLVLRELISVYFTKHLEVHRSADAFNFVAQQSDEVRARLNQTEEELKQLKGDAGITSLNESMTNLNTSVARTGEALQAAQAELAEEKAVIQEMEKVVASQEEKLPNAGAPIENAEAIQQYHTIVDRLRQLRETQVTLLSKYLTKPNQPVSVAQEGIRQVGKKPTGLQDRTRPSAFIGSERDAAQTIARERYRRQNDAGFSYQAYKKDFDTLVKEAEAEILAQKNTAAQEAQETQEAKESESQLVKFNQMQIENLEKQRMELENKFPGIAASVPISRSQNPQADISPERSRLAADRARLETERWRLAGIEARTEALKSRLSELQKQTQTLADFGPRIEQLQRAKEIEENNYKYFQASLEKARVDEALDPSKMPNISIVQSPSTAFSVIGPLMKIVFGLAGGGIALGIGLAILLELVLNRTVKRPLELETLLGTPLLLSVPYLNGRRARRLNGKNRLRLGGLDAIGKALAPVQQKRDSHVAPWDFDHPIRRFAETIRDRLILYFELNQMNHKPKLVAVTGLSEGAGTSTIGAGLAAALSETGDGKVLLVDMNGRPEAHSFSMGAPACSLSDALVGDPAPAGENLYLAVAGSADRRRSQVIPKRFYDLMPHLKASDFDYIIFDMPPLGQTSVTLPMARFMDKVLVVAEAEATDRDFVKRAYTELLSCGADVWVILNKVRSYGPRRLGAAG